MKQFLSLNLAFWFVLSSLAQASPSVQCWGNNAQGQTTVPTDIKFNAAAPVKPVEIRTARGATCALDQGGKVTCWGIPIPGLDKLQALSGVKTFGISGGGACALVGTKLQCFSAMGDSNFENVPALKAPKSVSVGSTFACAIDGITLHCWGGDTEATDVPKLKNPKKVLATDLTACALDDKGMHCWGDQQYNIESVPTLTKPTDFFLGRSFACAFDSKGLECWGVMPGSGFPAIPVVVNPITTTQYVTGFSHVCGLDKTGAVQCWGDNSLGQLQVPALSHPTQIFGDSSGNQTCALDDNGVECWGEDQAGQSSFGSLASITAGLGSTCVTTQGKLECWGTGSKAITSSLPLTDAYQVSLGSNFACAVDVSTTSAQSCWGDNTAIQNASIQLPTVDYTQGYQRVLAPTLTTAGYNHACYTSNQGSNSVTCIGNNDFGQSKPPANFVGTGNTGSLSAGGNHTCGIDAALGLQCWGEDENGESTPPTTLKNPRLVASGFYHTCALDDNGVTCWGRSTEGQTTVPKLVNPRMIQAGGYHTCALDDNGVTCWGENSFGQSTVPASLAVVGQGHKISSLATGEFHSCAVTQ